jgi:hypothetical protein
MQAAINRLGSRCQPAVRHLASQQLASECAG